MSHHDYRCTPQGCYQDCPARLVVFDEAYEIDQSTLTLALTQMNPAPDYTTWSDPNADPAADIRAAMEKIKHWEPPPLVISPQARDAVNQLLDRPKDAPVSKVELNAAVNIAFDRASDAERERFLMIANSYSLGGLG